MTEISWVPPYRPIVTELEGFSRINSGIRLLRFEIMQGNLAYWRRSDQRTIDDGFCLGLGAALVVTGVWQLRVPIIIGATGYIFASYSNTFRSM